jgi:hypothetical protein
LLADALDLSGTEISNILDAAPLVARMPFVPSSNGTTHKYITHTSNPTVAFRAANAGREFDHSVDTVVSATLTILDYSFAVDKALADAWRQGGAEALIGREGLRHIRAAMAKLEDEIINSTDSGGSGFVGLKALTTLDGIADAMVVDAEGTTATTGSSVYLLNLGDTVGVAGVYKGDGPMVELGETIVQDMNATNSHYPVYYTPGCSYFGLQIGGAFSASRIVNLTEDSGKGLTDDLIAEALALHPVDQRPNVIVCNRRSLRQLQQSRTATNATGAPAPFPSESFGIEIIVTDAIPNTEAILA